MWNTYLEILCQVLASQLGSIDFLHNKLTSADQNWHQVDQILFETVLHVYTTTTTTTTTRYYDETTTTVLRQRHFIYDMLCFSLFLLFICIISTIIDTQ